MNNPAWRNQPGPQRQPQSKSTPTYDPQNQVLCPTCGGADLKARFAFYRLPGQVIGSVDLTFSQIFICEGCGEPVNVTTAPVRKDVQKFEAKPA